MVKLYLLSLADQEVRVARPPGCAVQLTCAWLLQRRFVTEAREVSKYIYLQQFYYIVFIYIPAFFLSTPIGFVLSYFSFSFSFSFS